jgi:hypothetical protein
MASRSQDFRKVTSEGVIQASCLCFLIHEEVRVLEKLLVKIAQEKFMRQLLPGFGEDCADRSSFVFRSGGRFSRYLNIIHGNSRTAQRRGTKTRGCASMRSSQPR